MIELLAAVVVASLLGSMHCVGMCGPLALWASGAGGDARGSDPQKAQVWLRLIAYHGGRLLTYLTAGMLAGIAGAMLTVGGAAMGLQALAARVVGGAMIALAFVRLAEWWFPKQMQRRTTEPSSPGRIAGWIAQTRPALGRMPVLARGVAAGSLTTLLPCGWLYLFVLVAAGTGHPVPAVVVMFAFWLGTLPALTALVAGSARMAPKIRPALPMVAAIMLLVTGVYTATGRAAADFSHLQLRAASVAAVSNEHADAMDRTVTAARTLDALSGENLPCCENAD